MASWIRFEHAGRAQTGKILGDEIEIYQGNLFEVDPPQATGERVALSAVKLLIPCRPGKFLGLWNNFHQRAAIEGLARPEHPLYFVKTTNTYLAGGETIRQPRHYDGPVVFEGELGIVIGKTCCDIREDEAESYIFGYTCVNDVTARAVLKSDPSFPQWVRAKSFDTFGVFGPAIVTGLEAERLTVRALINGVEKQNYPVADMFILPRQIVSLLSQDMTLYPGDLIACGTSFGTEAMPKGCQVEIVIDGIGTLSNRFA